jgi:hypothetical protein
MRTITLADGDWRQLPPGDMAKLLRSGMDLMTLLAEKKISLEATETALRIHPLKQFDERDF